MPTGPAPTDINVDRRQSPRIRCSGSANIVSLPSEGLVVPGRVLNLSRGGCSIETVSPLSPGTRAEILLHVNSASIRVVGEVRALRDACVLGVQFLLLSAGGKDILEELIQELARQRAIANLNGARLLPDSEAVPQMRPTLLNQSRSIAGTLVTLEKAEMKAVTFERPTLDAAHPVTTNRIVFDSEEIDLFI